jgi:hypothetical protein
MVVLASRKKANKTGGVFAENSIFVSTLKDGRREEQQSFDYISL